jgi:hypothetical protein
VIRAVWLAAAVAIVAAGAAVAALTHPIAVRPVDADGRLPATAMDVVGEHCIEQSRAFDFVNLEAGYEDEGGRIEGFVILQAASELGGYSSDGTIDLGRRLARSPDRADVSQRLDDCLGRYAFGSELLPFDRAARLRLYQYQRTVYLPCLARHRVDAGAPAPLSAYLAAQSIRELGGLGAQAGRSFDQVLAAVRACPSAPDDLFG